MALGNQSAAALGRASRRLKDLASDSISIPSQEELYARACEKVADAKAAHAKIVDAQLLYEKQSTRTVARTDEFIAAKKAARLAVERAEQAAFVAKAPIVAARKLRAQLPHEIVLADAARFQDVFAHCKRGSEEQIKAAQEEHDTALIAWKLCHDNPSRDKAMVVLDQARLRLMVAMGPPYPERRARMFSKETISNERKRQGLE